jgi:tetratricopeptide (TPR) repeat protein
MCAVSTIRSLVACLGLTFGLSGAGSSAALAEQALPREDLLALEQALAQLNFDPGKIDGTVDDQTRAAVRLYQEFAALEPDGEITQSLISEIRSVAESFKDLRGAPAPAESASTAPSPPPAPPVAVGPPQAPALAPEPKQETAAAPEPQAAAPEPKPAPPAQAAVPAPAVSPAKPPVQAEAKPQPQPQPEAAPPAKAEPKTESPVAEAKPAPAKAPPASKQAAANPPAETTPQASAQEPPAAKPEAPATPPASGYDVGGLLSRLKAGGDTATPPAQPNGLGTAQVARLPDQGTESRAPAVAEFGGDGYGALRAGYLAAQSGDLERAIRLYTEALESQKLTLDHAAGAHYNRANAFFYLGDFDKAIDDYAAAIGNKPGFANAYYNRGFAFQAKGDQRQAIENFHRARDLGLQRLGVRAPDVPPPLQ